MEKRMVKPDEIAQVYEYTKRLGQQHWSDIGESMTLCGMPMLGNNYARHMEKEDKIPCLKCLVVLENLNNHK